MSLAIRILAQDNHRQMSLLYAARQISFEEKAEKIMAAHFNREGRLVRKAVRKTWPKGLRGAKPGSGQGGMRNIRSAVNEAIRGNNSTFESRFKTQLTLAGTSAGQILSSRLGSTWPGFPPEVENYITARIPPLTNIINQTSLNSVMGIVKRRIEEGRGVYVVQKDLQTLFSGMRKDRAKLIAQTEMGMVMSVTERAVVDRLDNRKDLLKGWLTAQDEKVRPTHHMQEQLTLPDAGGVAIEMDATFSNGLQYPRDAGGSAEEIIACRCTLLYFPRPDSDEERRKRRTGAENKTYVQRNRLMNAKEETWKEFEKVEPMTNFDRSFGGDAVARRNRRLGEKFHRWVSDGTFTEAEIAQFMDDIAFHGTRRRAKHIFDSQIDREAAIKTMGERFSEMTRDAWNATSANAKTLSLAMQRAAVEELGIEVTTSHLSRHSLETVKRLLDKGANRKIMKMTLRHQYEVTQAMLAEAGIEEVTLFRGLHLERKELPPGLRSYKGPKGIETPINGFAEVDLQPLSSFASDPRLAQNFGSTVLVVRVPASQVFGFSSSGIGVSAEYEWILIGQKKLPSMVVNLEELLKMEMIRWSEMFSGTKELFDEALDRAFAGVGSIDDFE